MKSAVLYVVIMITSMSVGAQFLSEENRFEKENISFNWKLSFDDNGTGNWQKKWFVDGVRGSIENSSRGMLFSAGPVDGDHACHSVLWTKKSFKGDIKITYEYTRTDAWNKWVNIIYIQATGIGHGRYVKDIREWTDLRIIPYMNTYFNYMNALQISYAAYGDTLNVGPDYIRLRKYPVEPGAVFNTTTEIAPSFFDTKLFKPGKTYKITIIKRNDKLYFQIKGEGLVKLYTWNISQAKDITEGRIGLRHMFTRSALYKNFQVFTFK